MKVLISGGGVAGPALAHVLADSGHQVVIVELASARRSGGQLVDIRGTSQEAAARMGLLTRLQANQLAQQGLRYVNRKGRSLGQLGVESLGGNGPVAELEILRDDITRVLNELTEDRVEYRYGDSITGIEERDQDVRVSFDRHAEETYDLVVGADGVHSKVRALVWGPEQQYARALDGITSLFSVPEPEPLNGWSLMQVLPGRRTAMLRPSKVPGRAQAILTFFGDLPAYVRQDVAAQKEILRTRFADAGWHLPMILGALADSPEFYLDQLAQVRVPDLFRGRVVLLGDAGYCPSPLSGQGTALALIGAYVLGQELITRDGHTAALTGYQQSMTAHIDAGHELPPGATTWAAPRSSIAVRAVELYLRAATRPPLINLVERALSSQHDVPLPDYPVARAADYCR